MAPLTRERTGSAADSAVAAGLGQLRAAPAYGLLLLLLWDTVLLLLHAVEPGAEPSAGPTKWPSHGS